MLADGTNFLLILLGFGLLIFVHELGHFLAARWAGIRVDAFAVGMGPTVLSWRRGIGVRTGSSDPAVVAKAGKPSIGLRDDELAQHGIGETEYSLRLLPIGGFVRMLGQDDLDPGATSDSARSYNRCGIGKRMVVVSAGVVANLLLAVVLFLVAFLAGVRFEAPVIGEVATGSPAAAAAPLDEESAGPGLRSGDVIREIDGRRIDTFADVQIAAAMAHPDRELVVSVDREGFDAPLRFSIRPKQDESSGLLAIGITPAAGNRLADDEEIRGFIDRLLLRTGLAEAGVAPGMTLVSAAGEEVRSFDQVKASAARSEGRAIATRWRLGEVEIEAALPVEPTFEQLVYPARMPTGAGDYEFGLLGLVPLVRIEQVLPDGPNAGVLEPGDLVLRIDSLDGPKLAEFRSEVMKRPGGSVRMLVARGDTLEPITVDASVDRNGRVGVAVGYARSVPLVARPFDRLGRLGESGIEPIESPAAPLALLPRTRLLAVDGAPVEDWASFREALRRSTEAAFEAGEGARVELTVLPPTPEAPAITEPWTLSAADVASLHELGWSTPIPAEFFDPIYTVLSADGSPWRAIEMGFEQTWKMAALTYLTIDRLVRGTVGVEQLHGPVGIVHLGTRVADRGLMYLVFFLAMISVNLAVLNFLPLPIVDGGLFLFLLYEKFRGRPPSVAFQNAATLAGLMLLGGLFIVTFYNDLMRLLG
jgi:regulator of sigma E protease